MTQSMTEFFRGAHNARSMIPLSTFLRLLQDFGVLPNVITKGQASACFRAARFGPGGRMDREGTDMARITFDEFIEAMGRIALIGFNWQPVVEEEQHMTFTKGSYHSECGRDAQQETEKDVERCRPVCMRRVSMRKV